MTRARWVEPFVLLLLAAVCTGWAQPPSRVAFFENALLRFLLFTIPFALFLSRTELLPASKRDRWILLGIIVGAAVARFSIRPLPYHPFHWMNDLVGRVSPEPEPAWYANGYGIFMWLFTLPGLDPDQAIFLGNRVAGVLSVVALYGAVRALGGTTTHALWSAFLLALLPLHVRMSSSESMQVIPGLFLLLSVIGFAGHARDRNRALLFVGISSFSYACLTRPEVSVVALALPLLYVGRDARPALRDPWLWFGALAAIAIGGPLVRAGALPHGVAWVSPTRAWQTFADAVSDAGAPHRLFALLGFFGFLVFHRTRQVSVLFLSLSLAVQIQLAGFETNAENRLQLLTTQFPWLLAGAGIIPAFLVDVIGRDSKPLRLGLAGVAAAVLSLSTLSSQRWAEPGPQQLEWVFLETAIPELMRANLNQLVRPQRPDFSHEYIASLPAYRLPDGMKLYSVTDALEGRVSPPFAYYRSPDCVLGTGWLLCSKLESGLHLRPIATTHIDNLEIGFFEATRETTQ